MGLPQRRVGAGGRPGGLPRPQRQQRPRLCHRVWPGGGHDGVHRHQGELSRDDLDKGRLCLGVGRHSFWAGIGMGGVHRPRKVIQLQHTLHPLELTSLSPGLDYVDSRHTAQECNPPYPHAHSPLLFCCTSPPTGADPHGAAVRPAGQRGHHLRGPGHGGHGRLPPALHHLIGAIIRQYQCPPACVALGLVVVLSTTNNSTRPSAAPSCRSPLGAAAACATRQLCLPSPAALRLPCKLEAVHSTLPPFIPAPVSRSTCAFIPSLCPPLFQSSSVPRLSHAHACLPLLPLPHNFVHLRDS